MRRHLRFLATYGRALGRHHVEVTAVMGSVVVLTLLSATAMYLVEGGTEQFPDYWSTVYWAAQTISTVGYGDLAPATVPGQVVATVTSLLGAGFLVVTAGILATFFVQALQEGRD